MGGLELGGKRVIVTGAAGGLGRAFAEAFAAAGASVVAADIDVAGAEETARLIAAKGGRALPQAVDVTDLASAERLARVAHEGLGGADVLVNNAAVYAGLQRTSFESISEAEWDRVMSVNVKGTWIMTRAVAPLLRASGGGAIVNVSSATVMSGSPMWLHYVSSKGAIIAMTRALARELGDDNVTVNAIAPGLTLTGASLGLIGQCRRIRRDAGRAEARASQWRYRRRGAVSRVAARDLRHRPDACGRWWPAVPLAWSQRSPRRRLCRRRHAPDRVADVISHQQRALFVEPHADRAALGVAVVVEAAPVWRRMFPGGGFCAWRDFLRCRLTNAVASQTFVRAI